MKKQTKKTLAIVGAIAVGAGLALGGGLAGATMFPKTITEQVEIPVIQEKVVEKIIEVQVPVEVEKIVNQTIEKIVEVDNGNLDEVLDYIYDSDGNIEYVLDDLDDDEVDKIVDRIVMVNEAVKLGSDYIKDELADELDKEEFFLTGVNSTVTFDEDDVEKIKVKDDLDEIGILDTDFEDKQIEIVYLVDFEQDGIDYRGVVSIEVEDNEVEDISVVSVVEM